MCDDCDRKIEFGKPAVFADFFGTPITHDMEHLPIFATSSEQSTSVIITCSPGWHARKAHVKLMKLQSGNTKLL